MRREVAVLPATTASTAATKAAAAASAASATAEATASATAPITTIGLGAGFIDDDLTATYFATIHRVNRVRRSFIRHVYKAEPFIADNPYRDRFEFREQLAQTFFRNRIRKVPYIQ